jgi:hypothetical protein
MRNSREGKPETGTLPGNKKVSCLSNYKEHGLCHRKWGLFVQRLPFCKSFDQEKNGESVKLAALEPLGIDSQEREKVAG